MSLRPGVLVPSSGADNRDDEGNRPMEFRLTYAGPIKATQHDPREGERSKHVDNKHHIRKHFHAQLRRYWDQALEEQTSGPHFVTLNRGRALPIAKTKKALAARHALHGFNFVPLVTAELRLLCSLDILFFRPEKPGAAVWAGDLDNRLKTPLDAPRIPGPGENYSERKPGPDEQPFVVLLEDDNLVTRFAVETDRLLEPVEGSFDIPGARLVITVRIRPYELNFDNLRFG